MNAPFKSTKREVTKAQQDYIYLTTALDEEQLTRFSGENAATMRGLSENFMGVPFFVKENRVAVCQSEVDVRADGDHGITSRMTSVCCALEGIVRKGETVTSEDIEQATERALDAQKDSLTGSAEVTKDGKKIKKENVRIPELNESVIFESFVINTSCVEDASVTPSQTVIFLPSGKAIYSRLMGDNYAFLNKIKAQVGGITITPKGDKTKSITVSGDIEKINQARNMIISFANIVADFGYKKDAHLRKALACVLGVITSAELPDLTVSKKGGSKELPSAFSKMTVNELSPATDNQQRYLDLISDDKRFAVLAQGPAGTGKTRLFLQVAMRKLRDHYQGVPGANFSKLILSIPLVNVGGKDLGAMPGGLSAKTEMWFETYYSHLVRILAPRKDDGTPDLATGTAVLDNLTSSGIIEIAPLEFLRGKSFDGALVALDEAQNATTEQAKTFLTRAEETSRLFMFGDLEQTDRSTTKIPQGEPFRVPTTVKIDENGVVSVDNNKRWMEVGFHKDIGHFVLGTTPGHIEKVYPRNGFAKAILLYSGSLNISCTTLDFSDIQRSGVARDLLVLERGFRIAGDNTAGLSPKGVGDVNPHAILAAQSKVDAKLAAARASALKHVRGAHQQHNTMQ